MQIIDGPGGFINPALASAATGALFFLSFRWISSFSGRHLVSLALCLPKYARVVCCVCASMCNQIIIRWNVRDCRVCRLSDSSTFCEIFVTVCAIRLRCWAAALAGRVDEVAHEGELNSDKTKTRNYEFPVFWSWFFIGWKVVVFQCRDLMLKNVPHGLLPAIKTEGHQNV